jgi:hypothetical protein
MNEETNTEASSSHSSEQDVVPTKHEDSPADTREPEHFAAGDVCGLPLAQ